MSRSTRPEFELYFQPQATLPKVRLSGLRHFCAGIIQGAEGFSRIFIPIAEEVG